MRAVLMAAVLTGCASAEPLPRLAGSEWTPVEGELAETDSFIRFELADTVIANAGCNALRATYRQTDGQLAMSKVLSTRKLCAPDVMEREQALIAVLESTLHAELRDDGKLGLLVLRDAGGSELAVLRRSDWD